MIHLHIFVRAKVEVRTVLTRVDPPPDNTGLTLAFAVYRSTVTKNFNASHVSLTIIMIAFLETLRRLYLDSPAGHACFKLLVFMTPNLRVKNTQS